MDFSGIAPLIQQMQTTPQRSPYAMMSAPQAPRVNLPPLPVDLPPGGDGGGDAGFGRQMMQNFRNNSVGPMSDGSQYGATDAFGQTLQQRYSDLKDMGSSCCGG